MAVSRWSRLVGKEFLAWLAVPPGGRWLDVGCGTGALSETVLRRASPEEVLGIDPAFGPLAFARERITDDRAHFAIGDALSLPCGSGTYDAVVAGLVLNSVPDPAAAVGEMTRAARPGGTVAGYVWDFGGEMQVLRFFWDAAVTLDPQAAELDPARRGAICQPSPLSQLFEGAGLSHVEVRAIDVLTDFRDFAAYWSPFLTGRGTRAHGYVMSLCEAARIELRELLRARLPIARDGSIHLLARAWAVRAERSA
jgi:SAM-dependent methyltransferase